MIARPVGSSVRLKCTASGTPRPDILWLKDDQPLTAREVGEGRQKKWTLTLKNLMPEHSGRYTCRVSNRAGEINATYKVEVIREYPTERPGCTKHLEISMNRSGNTGGDLLDILSGAESRTYEHNVCVITLIVGLIFPMEDLKKSTYSRLLIVISGSYSCRRCVGECACVIMHMRSILRKQA